MYVAGANGKDDKKAGKIVKKDKGDDEGDDDDGKGKKDDDDDDDDGKKGNKDDDDDDGGKGKKDDDDDDDDGKAGKVTANPAAVELAQEVALQANLYAPNGTVQIDQDVQVIGSLIGRDIDVDQKATFALQSGWATPGVIYEAPPLPDAKPVIGPWIDGDLESAVLLPNYPNPFNPATTIRYGLVSSGYVRLMIYNTLGQQVRLLVDQPQAMGIYTVMWDGRNQSGHSVASGIYLAHLRAGDFRLTQKLLLLR